MIFIKRLCAVLAAAILCISLSGCKRDTAKQSQAPEETTSAIAQTEDIAAQPSETLPAESIEPVLDLVDAHLILANADFEGMEAPEGYEISDEDRQSLTDMVTTLRVTNDALAEIDKLAQEDDEYLLNAKAPINELMSTIKAAYEEGLALEHSDELEEFHRLYLSVLLLNYNGADIMTQALDGDDTELAAEAFTLFEQGSEQYSLLIDYANTLLGAPLPSASQGAE